MHKFYTAICCLIFLASCDNNSKNAKNNSTDFKSDQTLLTTSFNPAFLEHSTIIYSNNKDSQKVSILIKCYFRMRSEKDTLFYKTKVLTENESLLLDTTLIRMIRIPIVPRKNSKIADGISIDFDLIQGQDSVNRQFSSPTKTENPIGYIVTTKAINIFKIILNDEITSNYFDDLTNYMTDSAMDRSKERAIFKLRQKKYGR